jgi:restriction system protein
MAHGSGKPTQSKQSEIHLTNVARASLGELLEDFKDFLLLRGLPIWDKDDPRAIEIRRLAKPGEMPNYELYRPYIESNDPEVVGNAMICLIQQTNYLLDQRLRTLEKEFLEKGGIRERMTKARLEAREAQAEAPTCPLCEKPMRKRTARKGPHAGKAFWGCSAYPECRCVRGIEE